MPSKRVRPFASRRLLFFYLQKFFNLVLLLIPIKKTRIIKVFNFDHIFENFELNSIETKKNFLKKLFDFNFKFDQNNLILRYFILRIKRQYVFFVRQFLNIILYSDCIKKKIVHTRIAEALLFASCCISSKMKLIMLQLWSF